MMKAGIGAGLPERAWSDAAPAEASAKPGLAMPEASPPPRIPNRRGRKGKVRTCFVSLAAYGLEEDYIGSFEIRFSMPLGGRWRVFTPLCVFAGSRMTTKPFQRLTTMRPIMRCEGVIPAGVQ